MADWIESFVSETSKVPSPECYRLWAAITAVSGVLERKVWTQGSAAPIYPTVFTLLVGPPASGKTNAIRPIRELWSRIQGLHLCPDNVTKASLIDALAGAVRTVITSKDAAYIFSALVVPCSEFGVFFTHHDLEFLSVINHLFDAPSSYKEERRTSGKVEINKPYLILLAGTQPGFLSSFLPEEAWDMGTMSRMIMIYANEAPTVDLFAQHDIKAKDLTSGLAQIFKYHGEFVWEDAAKNELNAWNHSGCPPAPQHSRLAHYCGRRAVHALKLSMISSASRSPELIVTLEDFERAQHWLIEAEKRMPDVFRAMGQKGDMQIIADLHLHLYRLWSSKAINLRQPIPEKEVYKFLHTRVPSEKIARLIEVAEKTGYIKRGNFPDEWIPNSIVSYGKE